MKDYLNTEERQQIVSAIHLITDISMIIEGKTLNKTEKSDMKRAFTYIKKSIEGIKSRLNPSALKALTKDAIRSKVYLDVYNATEEYARKKESNTEAAYEENKDYFKLVELIMHYNCRQCKNNCTSCEIYHEFEARSIPEFSGLDNTGSCKYSYKEI